MRRYVIGFGLVFNFVFITVVSQARAEVFGGIDFPQGAASFADMLISYEPLFDGGPGPTRGNFVDPLAALGLPDYSGGSNGTGAVSPTTRRTPLSIVSQPSSRAMA